MFDEFWSLYPRKIAKATARKAWQRLSAEQQLMAAKAIDTHCQYWSAKETELEFIPHPKLLEENEKKYFQLAEASSGMDLRDYFAAKAMQGLLTQGENYLDLKARSYEKDVFWQYVGEMAYIIADEMLKARENV
jgi:hypothetical protein